MKSRLSDSTYGTWHYLNGFSCLLLPRDQQESRIRNFHPTAKPLLFQAPHCNRSLHFRSFWYLWKSNLCKSLFSKEKMSHRKFWISAFGSLRRNFRSTSRFSIGFYPKLESPGVFIWSYGIGKPPGYVSCRNNFAEIYHFSGNNFCSESAGGGFSRCWNCSAVPTSKPFLYCESCKSVQPVDTSADYFQIFGLDKEYEIKDVDLEKKYKDWQKKLHPDLVHSKSEKEKEYAAEQSARVIDAYRTLTKPLLRAIYMLRLEGVHVDEETTVSDPELLAEIMEIREAVEEADDPQSLNKIQCQMQEKLESWSKSFGETFKNKKYEEAITSTQRMTYYERVKEETTKKL